MDWDYYLLNHPSQVERYARIFQGEWKEYVIRCENWGTKPFSIERRIHDLLVEQLTLPVPRNRSPKHRQRTG